MANRIGEEFQMKTKYIRNSMSSEAIDWSRKPKLYKEYADAKRIPFPEPKIKSKLTLYDCLKNRKSIRSYAKRPLTIYELSYLLWASNGIRVREGGLEFRTAPSAGALYPIETYIVANRIIGLETGIYHYLVSEHSLEQLKLGDFGKEISMAALNQEMCNAAPVVFVWTAVFGRSKWKYGQRTYRYIYLDAGHIAQNLALSAVSIGLGSCQIAALFDDEVNTVIGVDGTKESTVYMSVAGHPIR